MKMKKIKKILLDLYSDKEQILSLGFLTYIGFLLKEFSLLDSNITYASWGMVAVGVGTLASSLITANQAEKNRDLASGQATDAEAREKEAAAILEKDKAAYRQFQFKDPYANITNTFEDLTVNLQQAQFEKQMVQQQQSNIMQQLQGAAGASGIAALAQSMSNQGQLQAQRAAASIGQQERANQLAAAKGESAQQMAQAGGKQLLQQMEMDRSATLLGMSAGSAGAAAAGLQQAYANQMAAVSAESQAWGAIAGNTMSALGQVGAAKAGGKTN
tara:strand:- start:349 stop:1167 length:819 start_codon:yes stop_codon:yes gene_type:complete